MHIDRHTEIHTYIADTVYTRTPGHTQMHMQIHADSHKQIHTYTQCTHTRSDPFAETERHTHIHGRHLAGWLQAGGQMWGWGFLWLLPAAPASPWPSSSCESRTLALSQWHLSLAGLGSQLLIYINSILLLPVRWAPSSALTCGWRN